MTDAHDAEHTISQSSWLIPLQQLMQQVGQDLIASWQKIRDHPAAAQLQTKADHTPLTQADLQANDTLVAGLKQILPNCPLISEEMPFADYQQRKQWSRCWIIDPLDGTKGFLHGSRHFSINVALIEQQRPRLGVVYHPFSQQFYAAESGGTAYRYDLTTGQQHKLAGRRFYADAVTVVVGEGSLRYSTRLVRYARKQGWQVIGVGSALKLAYMAAGQGDFYPRVGPIYEWDIAAGQCILEACGGAVVDLQGKALRYNQQDLLLPPLLAVSDATAVPSILDLIKGVYNNE